MKAKKLFTSALAAVMTFSSVVAIGSNASSYFPTINDSEEYQKRTKTYENNYLLTEQETEYFRNILSNETITKVWCRNKPTPDELDNYYLFDEYVFEVKLKDFLNVELDLPRENSELIIAELENLLCYDDFREIKNTNQYNCVGISISFNTDNHEMNYMIAEKAISILSEKYPISEKTLQIDAVNHIPHIRLQSCFTRMNGINPDEECCDNCRVEFYDEFYKSIDHDYIAKNFRAVYNPETYRVEFPDDYTQEEKLGCFSYFVEKYNARIHQYCQTAAMQPISADFSSDEISYLNGDANCDKSATMADAAAILQAIGNPDKYALSDQGEFNADYAGDGLTADDAIAIQKKIAGITE